MRAVHSTIYATTRTETELFILICDPFYLNSDPDPFIDSQRKMKHLLSLMNAAAECNNIGVALMQSGRLSDAVITLTNSAELMYDVSQYLQWGMNHPRHLDPGSLKSTLVGISAVRQARETMIRIPDQKEPIHTQVMNTANDTDNLFMSPYPIFLDIRPDLPHFCTYEAAAIIFNMGLAYYSCQNNNALLRAACLFEMAFGLAQMVPEDCRASPLAMASLNNTAYVFYSLGCYQLTTQYLSTLAEYIELLPETQDERERQERLHYLMNASYLRQPTIAGAA